MTVPSPETVADRLAISDLLIRYTVAIDTKDWALLDTVFLADATLDYTTSGGPRGPYETRVREWLQKALAPFTMTQHLLSNTSATIDGDHATSRTMFYNPMGYPRHDGTLGLFFVGGYYNDRLVRMPDGWRIEERVEEQSWLRGELPEGLEIPE